MDIFTINVGQGSLSFLRHNKEAIIIDSRIPPSTDETVPFVKGIFSKYLKGHFVKGLILTGFDADHSDAVGVSLVLSKYRPEWIMYPKYFKNTDAASDVFAVIKDFEKKCKLNNALFQRISVSLDISHQADLNNLSTNFKMQLFSPAFEDMSNSNNSSIVLRITGIGVNFSYLITGDTENERWKNINSTFGRLLKSDVMAAPHHGSRHSINPETLVNICPHTVLISAGVDNQYGHPHSQAVDAYSAIANCVYSTSTGRSLYTHVSNGAIKTITFID